MGIQFYFAVFPQFYYIFYLSFFCIPSILTVFFIPLLFFYFYFEMDVKNVMEYNNNTKAMNLSLVISLLILLLLSNSLFLGINHSQQQPFYPFFTLIHCFKVKYKITSLSLPPLNSFALILVADFFSFHTVLFLYILLSSLGDIVVVVAMQLNPTMSSMPSSIILKEITFSRFIIQLHTLFIYLLIFFRFDEDAEKQFKKIKKL